MLRDSLRTNLPRDAWRHQTQVVLNIARRSDRRNLILIRPVALKLEIVLSVASILKRTFIARQTFNLVESLAFILNHTLARVDVLLDLLKFVVILIVSTLVVDLAHALLL